MRYDRENRQIDKITREYFVKTIETQSKINLIASLCIFGTISLFVRNIALGSGMIALSRGVLGASFLLLYLALRKQKLDLPAIRSNFWILLLSGGVMGLNWALLFEAYRYTTVATATLCYYMQPVFLTLAATVVLREKLGVKKGLCVLVALCGMVLISGVIGGEPPEAGELRGIALGLGAACFYACVILCNKKLRDIGAFDKTIVQLLAAAAVMVPYCALTGERITAETFQPASLACLLVLGMFHTGFAYALYFGSMKALRAQTIAIFSYIDPVIAILISVTILHEPFSWLSAAGSVLILGAAFVSEKG